MRIPVIWGPAHRQHAKLYYTLQALRRPTCTPRCSTPSTSDGHALAARDEVEARALQLAFLESQGVIGEGIQRRLRFDDGRGQRAARRDTHQELRGRQRADVMIVNGKYSTSVSEAGGDRRSCSSLINDLAASEKSR